MVQPYRNSPSSSTSINRDSGPSSSSSSSTNREAAGAAGTSSSSNSSAAPYVREEEEHRNPGIDQQQYQYTFGQPEIEQQHAGVSYRGNWFAFDDASVIRDDSWSCVVVVLTFWFFVALTLILGVYGASSMNIGPYASILLEPNPIFVQSIKVEELDDNNSGLILYGFYESPPLDVVTTWSKTNNVSVPSDSHKDWSYFLNEGSQINISYTVDSSISSVFLVIAQGDGGLARWLEDPTYPNTTLSWNVIHGSGIIQQTISKSSNYYVAVGNPNSDDIKVQLNIKVRSLTYNTTQAYYQCTFSDGTCSISVLFPNGNAVVLTSLGSEQGSTSDEWYVKVSYGPRWATYIVGIAGMTTLMLVAFNFLNKFQCIREEGIGFRFREIEPQRATLLSQKDDDLSSWGSSYDSLSNDDDDLEEFLATGSLEGQSSKDSENDNNTRRLCAICFDAPRDCFFLPCGHCVTCFACGTRIAEAAGTCPVCCRNMKKVRKIFSV